MPFIEVLGFDQELPGRRNLAERLTQAVATSFDISPAIVTIYFHPVPRLYYAHAGVLDPAGTARTFIKIHCYPRVPELKERCARRVCDAMVSAGAQADDVVTYFFERSPQDVAHAGKLSSST